MTYTKELVKLENIKIIGYKANIKNIEETLEKINSMKNNNSIIQLMDAKAIAGREHLKHGIIHAIKSFERNENLAKDLGIEILLRTSGQRQISKAFNILGLKKGKMDLAIVMINCLNETEELLNNMFDINDDVLKADESILKEIYNINEKELKTINITDVLIDKTTKLIVDN